MHSINSVRIVTCDYYMTQPIEGLNTLYSEFRGSAINQVPVIRIFGSTNTGKKICLHIHGVFPYLYIPYDGCGAVNTITYQIAANLDKAINISLGQTNSTNQHVYKVSHVGGIPFYGYHRKEHQFFKIYLYNPALVRKVSGLLENGAVLGKKIQPHEAHINYILQFMIDYNLHGMSTINLSEILSRDNISSNSNQKCNVSKMSVCELEGDALAENILNRLDVCSGKFAVNPGISALWEDEKQRRRNKNEDSLIEPCLTLTKNNAVPTNSHFMFQKMLKQKLSTAAPAPAKIDPNASVYAIETPENETLSSASSVDFHSSFTLLSSDDSLVDLNNTCNATLDEDAQNLFDILKDLGNNQNAQETEQDSILSQMVNEDNEEEFDLSLPLDNMATPLKMAETCESDEDLWDDPLDKTLVPQLDERN